MESTGKQGQERDGEVLLPALAALPAADSRKCLRFSACDLISIADVLGSCVQPGNFDIDILLVFTVFASSSNLIFRVP
jgi:hypothetical protein